MLIHDSQTSWNTSNSELFLSTIRPNELAFDYRSSIHERLDKFYELYEANPVLGESHPCEDRLVQHRNETHGGEEEGTTQSHRNVAIFDRMNNGKEEKRRVERDKILKRNMIDLCAKEKEGQNYWLIRRTRRT
ncbi:hypothetical protein HZH68_012295 [Vespula germanica]|uniref:Uncharacterized protein n=1 Tax=Vespula germanica TaxID=30212 RepID=A0A834MZ67_VESGE|nr:hypothetical protein HZH68_012295 [Vespula germanica]